MKRILSLVLTACLLLGILGPVASAGEEKETIKVLLTKNILTKEPETVGYLQAMADQANVNIEWEVHTYWTDAYTELKSVMLASGDLPDVLLCDGSILNSDLAQFSTLFADFNELLDYAPNMSKILEENPAVKNMVTNDEGQILGMFQYMGRQPQVSTRQMVNTVWLENVGMEIPTTWDELFDVLIAFRDNDANGNGDPSDEIPMDWGPSLGYFNAQVMVATLGLPVALNMAQGYYVEDGVVNNLFLSDEFKQYVTFMNKCYVEGLINENVFTQDYTSFQGLSRANRVGFTFGWDILDRMGPDLAEQYVTVAPLKPTADYDGEILWDNSFNAMNYRFPVGAISASSENKEAAMRFVDLFYDPIYSIQSYWGTLGECIQDNGDGSYTVLPPADTSVDPGSWKWTNALADASPMFVPDDLSVDLPEDLQVIADLDVVYEEALAQLGADDIWPGPFLKYTSDESTNLSFFGVDIENIIKNNYANFVISGNIEEGWEDYIGSLNSAGIQDAIAIYQAAYDRYAAALQ